MLPAPTSIAAPPSPRSRVSWNPAVPPPPVAGGAVGIGLVEWLSVTAGDADGGSEGVAEGVAGGVTEGLGLAPGWPTPAGRLDDAAGAGAAPRPGEEGVVATDA